MLTRERRRLSARPLDRQQLMSKGLLITAWLIPTALWLLAMTRWRRGILQCQPAGSAIWYWLRVLGIPATEQNRAGLLLGAAAAGITMVTIGILLVLISGSE